MVQLEPGSSGYGFEQRFFHEELQLCQLHNFQTYGGGGRTWWMCLMDLEHGGLVYYYGMETSMCTINGVFQ